MILAFKRKLHYKEQYSNGEFLSLDVPKIYFYALQQLIYDLHISWMDFLQLKNWIVYLIWVDAFSPLFDQIVIEMQVFMWPVYTDWHIN